MKSRAEQHHGNKDECKQYRQPCHEYEQSGRATRRENTLIIHSETPTHPLRSVQMPLTPRNPIPTNNAVAQSRLRMN